MKASKYNHFIPFSEDESIAYNALSNSLALIKNENLQIYNSYINEGIKIENTQLFNDLVRGSFLIDDNLNELDVVRYNMLRGRFATNVLTLTIAPTSECNFSCTYCYEKKILNSEYMSEKVQDAIIHLLEKQKFNLQALSVVWYGGEPLLAISIVKSLSLRLMQICKESNISYSAYMITNGYLLTKENLAILHELEINFLQVTLDGNEEQHNKRRPLANGGKTFKTILNNLRNGYDLLPKVSLRVNIDKDNMLVGDEIMVYLKEYGLLDKVIPYYGCVRNDNDCYEEQKCISSCDFAEKEYEFAIKTYKRHRQYPSLKSSFCCADRLCGYVIAADGAIYKCWSDIGNLDKSIGNILESFNYSNDIYLKYMLFDPTQLSPCKECDILPICMGGCPFQRLSNGRQQCSNYKYILKKCLKNMVCSLKIDN